MATSTSCEPVFRFTTGYPISLTRTVVGGDHSWFVLSQKCGTNTIGELIIEAKDWKKLAGTKFRDRVDDAVERMVRKINVEPYVKKLDSLGETT